eukprot:9404147-Pyramimonas_sp.AAC.1
MRRMPGGHGTIRVDEFQSPPSFRCPASLFQQHPGLKESDFQCDSTVGACKASTIVDPPSHFFYFSSSQRAELPSYDGLGERLGLGLG